MDWLNSELYALLAIKTADTAMASIKSLEEVEVKGIIGWQSLEREARVYHRRRVALLTESLTHLDRVLKVTDLPQAFYRRESSLKEFQRGRPAELEDDVGVQRNETHDAEGNPGCCGLAAEIPHFLRGSGLHFAAGAELTKLVAKRLDVLLDEDEFRSSSRARERESSLLVSQLHVEIQTI